MQITMQITMQSTLAPEPHAYLLRALSALIDPCIVSGVWVSNVEAHCGAR